MNRLHVYVTAGGLLFALGSGIATSRGQAQNPPGIVQLPAGGINTLPNIGGGYLGGAYIGNQPAFPYLATQPNALGYNPSLNLYPGSLPLGYNGVIPNYGALQLPLSPYPNTLSPLSPVTTYPLSPLSPVNTYPLNPLLPVPTNIPFGQAYNPYGVGYPGYGVIGTPPYVGVSPPGYNFLTPR